MDFYCGFGIAFGRWVLFCIGFFEDGVLGGAFDILKASQEIDYFLCDQPKDFVGNQDNI